MVRSFFQALMGLRSPIRVITSYSIHYTKLYETKYSGGLMDNRPTKAYDETEYRSNPGYYIRFADQITLKNCSVEWGANVPEYFTNAVEAHDVTSLDLDGVVGRAAHPEP